MPDLPSFQVVPPRPDLRVEDFTLPDGSPLVGPNGYLVPPAREFSMVVNAATRMYSYRFDEAMRDNWVQARAMRRDAFIRALLEERMLPTINRKWQLEVDDDRDPNQKAVKEALTKLVAQIPDFDAFKRALVGDGCWYGRAGTQWNYARNPEVDDLWGIKKWDPVHGDSIQFTYDGVPAILLDAMTAGWYSSNGATQGQWGDIRSTDRGGMALVLQRPTWRDRFAIYQHIREKADYFEGELAGSVQGLGLRGLVYWQYLIRTDALTWMLAYMQSVGQMDMLIFNYPWGNDAAKNQQQANANKIIGKAAFIVPRNPQGNWEAVEQLQMNDAGLKALHSLISEYFDRNIERLVVGQSMSAGADNESGMGGTGRADFAKATKDEILVYDTGRCDNVMTRDVVGPLKRHNFKWARFPVRFKSILPNLDAKDKVESGKTMVELKVPIKMDEFREAAGYSRPEANDEIVQPPPDPMAAGGVPGAPGAPPADPNAPPPQPGERAPMIGPGGTQQIKPPVQLPPAAAPQPASPAPASGSFSGGFGASFNSSPVPVQLYDASPAPAPAAAPAYFPGGGNTYVPRWDERETIGFTRLSRGQDPTEYVTDATGHEHKEAGQGGGQFTGSGSGGSGAESETASAPPQEPSTDGVVRAESFNGLLSIDEYGSPSGVKDLPPTVVKGYRVGATDDKFGRGLFFSGDRKGAEAYAKLHPGHEVKEYKVSLQKPILVGHQNDLCKALFNKTYSQMYSGGVDAGRKADVKIARELIKRGYDGIIYLKPAPPAKTEIAVLKTKSKSGTASPYLRGEEPTLYKAKLGCVMVPLQGLAAIELLGRANLVRDCDLADDGREERPHVTLKYGFHEGVITDDVERALRGKGPFELTLGKVSCFYGADTDKDYDVVKVDVSSPQLKAMNSILGELPHSDTHSEFKPHATIAYVKAGKGKEYVRLLAPVDLTVVVDELEYSDSEKAKSYFKLRGLRTQPKSVQYARDAAGHEHRGAGEGGGQFTGSGGGSGDKEPKSKKAKKPQAAPAEEVGGEYKPAPPVVDGRRVRDGVPNTGSIGSSVDDPEILPGLREIPVSAFDPSYKPNPYSKSERERLDRLVAEITHNKEISPLIIVIDDQGPYVLEGGHRFDALLTMGAKSFPALVVIDKSTAGDDPAGWNWKFTPKTEEEPKADPVSPPTAKVLSRLPATAYSRLVSRVTEFKEAPTVEAVTDAWYAGEPNPPPADKRVPCYGFYDPGTGQLLVGPGGKGVDQVGTLAHEIGHALDQSDDRKHFDLSGHPEFVSAWREEMGRGQLSNYAKTDEVEGFAEACRLAYGTEGGMETFRGQFPKCYAYFSKVGLV